MLYAEHRRGVLIVLQGMDSAGKDGTIRRVFTGVNPQGVRVASFRTPTAHELDHDFLWRVHEQLPARGEMVLFNRSHYEDVLVTRVHHLVPKEVWERRYREINEFERTLVQEGTTVLKFFLHIGRGEQKRRLKERLADPTKHWKFALEDLDDRGRWADYMTAYEEAIDRTSTGVGAVVRCAVEPKVVPRPVRVRTDRSDPSRVPHAVPETATGAPVRSRPLNVPGRTTAMRCKGDGVGPSTSMYGSDSLGRP